MKPKEYKQKSMKEKEKTKEDYEIQKARREVYEENIKRRPEKISIKIFQQEGAKSYSSKLSINMLQFLFKNEFIPTWNEGVTINIKFIPKWPPNSPSFPLLK